MGDAGVEAKVVEVVESAGLTGHRVAVPVAYTVDEVK